MRNSSPISDLFLNDENHGKDGAYRIFLQKLISHPMFTSASAMDLGAVVVLAQFMIARGMTNAILHVEAEYALRSRGVVNVTPVIDCLSLLNFLTPISGSLSYKFELFDGLNFESISHISSTTDKNRRTYNKKIPNEIVDGMFRLCSGENDISPVVVRLKLKGGLVAGVTEGFIGTGQNLFPNIDVHSQLLLASAWCEANEGKRKLATGIKKFINSWLTGASTNESIRRSFNSSVNKRNGFGGGGEYRKAAETLQKPAEIIQSGFSFGDDVCDDDFGLSSVNHATFSRTAVSDGGVHSSPDNIALPNRTR